MRFKIPTMGRKGFSLIELIVVIGIISVLTSFVLVSLSGARERALDGRRITDTQSIRLTLELYYEVNKEYPDNIYGAGVLSPVFIGKVPQDPAGGNYSYENLTSAGGACSAASGSCTRYHLG